MEQIIIDQVLNAEARALATTGPHGVNVVPVSVVEVEEGSIRLFNFFMQKSVENLLAEPEVALTCWSGLEGVQVKATAAYLTEGELFAAKVAEMKERFPSRTLAGVIELTPTAVFDVSADSGRAGKRLG